MKPELYLDEGAGYAHCIGVRSHRDIATPCLPPCSSRERCNSAIMSVQIWAVMGGAVFLAIAARAAQRDRDDRAAFLQSSVECVDAACECPLCLAQPRTKAAHHVAAYMVIGLLLPW